MSWTEEEMERERERRKKEGRNDRNNSCSLAIFRAIFHTGQAKWNMTNLKVQMANQKWTKFTCTVHTGQPNLNYISNPRRESESYR